MTTLMSLQPWSWQIFVHVVAIFPNVCLWRRNLCSNLENCIEPTSYASTAYVVAIWPSFLFRLFCKNLGHLREFFGQMVYCPPWQKISRTPVQRIVKAWTNPRWGGGLLPYISHIGMCCPIGSGFCAVLVWNRVLFSRELQSVWTYLSFQFQMSKERKRNMQIWNGFE